MIARPVVAFTAVVALVGCGSDPASIESPPAATEPVTPSNLSTSAPSSSFPPPSVPPSSAVVPPTVDSTDRALDGDWFDFALGLATPEVRDVVAVVWRDGDLVHSSVRSRSGRVDLDSRFRLASISKTITAVAVLKLVERGRIHLDDRPLADLAASVGETVLDPQLADVTVAQLLSHTSGVDSFRDDFFDSPEITADDLVKRILATPPVAAPGTEFLYSNANYLLLGRLVEMVAGETNETFVRREILVPLGIDGMRYGSTQVDEPGDADHASGAGRNYMELLEGAGAWIGSARQTLRFLSALASGEVLDAESSALMSRPIDGPDDESWAYGSGVIVWDDGSWGHTGSLESSRSLAIVRPDGTIVVVLVNGDEPLASGDLVAAVEAGLGPRPVPSQVAT